MRMSATREAMNDMDWNQLRVVLTNVVIEFNKASDTLKTLKDDYQLLNSKYTVLESKLEETKKDPMIIVTLGRAYMD